MTGIPPLADRAQIQKQYAKANAREWAVTLTVETITPHSSDASVAKERDWNRNEDKTGGLLRH